MRIRVLVVAMFGCGSVNEVSIDAPVDVPPDEPPLGAFSRPALIAELSDSTANDNTPTVSADRLEIFFRSDRVGGLGSFDIWTSRRPNASSPWSAPTLVTELSSTEFDSDPSLSADGLTIWLASSRGANPHNDLFVSTRATGTSPWAAPIKVTELETPDDDRAIAITANELAIVFFSARAGGSGNNDLYAASRATKTAPFQSIRAVAELNTSGSDSFPALSADGLTLVYTTGDSQDLMLATRPSTERPFGVPMPIDELNSAGADSAASLSPDLRQVVFSSDRAGSEDLYESSR